MKTGIGLFNPQERRIPGPAIIAVFSLAFLEVGLELFDKT
jgi:hypothetical protein